MQKVWRGSAGYSTLRSRLLSALFVLASEVMIVLQCLRAGADNYMFCSLLSYVCTPSPHFLHPTVAILYYQLPHKRVSLPSYRSHDTWIATEQQKRRTKKHTTAGVRWSSPTQLLVRPTVAYVRQIGRDAQLSTGCGRM